MYLVSLGKQLMQKVQIQLSKFLSTYSLLIESEEIVGYVSNLLKY